MAEEQSVSPISYEDLARIEQEFEDIDIEISQYNNSKRLVHSWCLSQSGDSTS